MCLAVQASILENDNEKDQPLPFRLSLDGNVMLDVTWPSTLRNEELAQGATIHIASQDWIFSRNSLCTRWKNAAALASKNAIAVEFASADPARAEATRIVAGVLHAHPLALRIVLLRSGEAGKEGFYLIGALYPSEKLKGAAAPVGKNTSSRYAARGTARSLHAPTP